MIRALLLGLLLLFGASSPDQAIATTPTPFFLDNNIVPKITCGEWMGTGVYVGKNLVATAKHVVENGSCKISGLDVTIVYRSPTNDFALVRTPFEMGLRAIISCKGFHEGEHYYATGYAQDAPRTVTQRWLGSAARSDAKGFVGLMVFRGSATSGMSGGPVNDDDGATVGLIEANSEDGVTIALGLPFTDTPLCKKG